MAIKALKIILTLVCGAAIFWLASVIPSQRLVMQISVLPVLLAAILLIGGFRPAIGFFLPTAAFAVALFGAHALHVIWPGFDVLRNLAFPERLEVIMSLSIVFAVTFASIIFFGMKTSDLIDHCRTKYVH
jgi:hypothetical protein